jgi:3-oxoacyl-[acyl-carrier protein] reductase
MTLQGEIAGAFSLAGKVAVVTGAASGIGRESARVLAQAGARIVGADINAEGLAETGKLIAGEGGQFSSRVVDIADKTTVEALADSALAECGGLDVWINCAAISPLHTILETDPDVASQTIAINLQGTYWGCMAAGRVMGAHGGGAIINISSAGGLKPVPNLAIYGMTKAAVNSLTWTAATEFGPLGIRVNAIAPGWIETPAFGLLFRDESGAIDEARRAQALGAMVAVSPLGRIGQVSDIAYALVYLASQAGSFVTGQILRVNGGESMG